MATFEGVQQASAFEVKVLQGIGNLVSEGDKFDLIGRALPYRGFSFEVTQRIQTTWYPGNPVALQQAMGATESNTTISGIWKDRYLGVGPSQDALAGGAFQQVGDGQAAVLASNFELLCRYAVPVEVRWGTGYVDGNITGIVTVRRGLIKRVKITPDRPQDLAWEIEFEWRGTDDTAAKPVAVRLTDARDQLAVISAQFQDASDQINGLKDQSRSLLFGLPAAFSAAMEDLTTQLDKVNEAVADQVAGVVGGIHADGGLLDNGNASYAVALLKKSADSIKLGEDQIAALPIYALSVKDDALDLLSTVGSLFNLNQFLAQVRANATSTADDMAGQVHQDAQAEVFAPAGTDLRDLALQFYGDPDLWYAIAKYNNLSTSRVPDLPTGPNDQAGLAIRIPKQTGSVTSVGDVC